MRRLTIIALVIALPALMVAATAPDEVTLDGQGRASLTRPLMEFAGIREKALIIGALDRIEIWDPDVFAQYLEEQTTDYETLAEQVMGG